MYSDSYSSALCARHDVRRNTKIARSINCVIGFLMTCVVAAECKKSFINFATPSVFMGRVATLMGRVATLM
jgi:hypothetical protein